MQSQNKIWFLHALRGIASFLVVIYHLGVKFWFHNDGLVVVFRYLQPIPGRELPILSSFANAFGAVEFNLGQFGVGLFFLVSGFVIPLSLEKTSGVRFLVARFFRIYPTYVAGFAITCLAILVYTAGRGMAFPHTAPDLLTQISLLRDWFWVKSLDGISWTLETEIKFYVLACLIAWLGKLRSSRFIVGLAFLMCAGNIVLRGQLGELLHANFWLYTKLRIAAFSSVYLVFMFLGICFYNYYRNHWPLIKFAVALSLTYLSFCLALLFGQVSGSINGHLQAYTGALLVFALFFVLRNGLKYNASIDFLANISYPLYIVHGLNGYILLTTLDGLHVHPVVSTVFTVAMALLVSYGLHVFIETPTNTLGRKLTAGRRAAGRDSRTSKAVHADSGSFPGQWAGLSEAGEPVILDHDPDFYGSRRTGRLPKFNRFVMSVFMGMSDLVCLVSAMLLAILLWWQVRADFIIEGYVSMIIPVAGCFMFAYALLGLYPGVGMGPVEELRRLTIGSSLVAPGLITLGFYLGNLTWSRAILALSWALILVSIPISRKIFRRIAARMGLWGLPVVVIGHPEAAGRLYNNLRRRPLTGLWPVLCVHSNSSTPLNLNQADADPAGSLVRDIDIAIIAAGDESFKLAKNILSDESHGFSRIIVAFDEIPIGPVWFRPVMLADHMGFEVGRNLIGPVRQAIKRGFDLLLILAALPFLILLVCLIAILIKLDSPGPVFYTQQRIGFAGRIIRMWKFRSMTANAEELLQDALDRNRSLRAEWEQNFKLRSDSRITRFGSLLRRTSLDELPQIWNVIRGEMSLIGPRPIVEEERPLYGREIEIYKRVHPGMTGLWQISGRNDLPYRERVSLDVHYVQNWSIWLDLHILMHTLLTILQGRGAY